MHATIQKPIKEIVGYIKPGEKVFVVGCNNCAWKCHSGGEDETKNMARRLEKRGVDNIAIAQTPQLKGLSESLESFGQAIEDLPANKLLKEI